MPRKFGVPTPGTFGSPGGATDQKVNLDQLGAVLLVGQVPNADGIPVPNNALPVMGYGMLFDIATGNWDRARSTNAAMIAAKNASGGQLTAQPGEATIFNAPAAGSVATATLAAGGAGVRHVLRSLLCSISAGVAIAATTVQLVVRDGATGVGTILWQINFNLAAAIIPPIVVPISGLNIVGSIATAMTVEYTALLANMSQSVNASMYDAT
jgi:hypothetical protein